MRRAVAALAVFLMTVTSLFGRNPTSPQQPQKLPLSPLFARLAWELQREIFDWSLQSDEPLLEGDIDSSPHSMRQKSIDDEMDRIREFDLKTPGDEKVFGMLEVAETIVLMDDISRLRHQAKTHLLVPCLSDIREAIGQRAYTRDGSCDSSKARSQMQAPEPASKPDENPSNRRQAQEDELVASSTKPLDQSAWEMRQGVDTARSARPLVFSVKCFVCHGPDGKGFAAIKTPDFTDPKWQASTTDAAIIDTIKNGKTGTPMPRFEDKLSEDEIKALVAYVRSLKNETKK